MLLSAIVLFGCGMGDNIIYPRQSTGHNGPAENPSAQPPVTTKEPPEQLSQRQSFFRQSSIPPTKIALLLPLSGQYRDLGQTLLDAAQLALFNVDEPNLILVPIDTKDTPFGAVEAANKAVAEGAKLILGPVFSQSAKSIASIAKAHNISVVSFSNDKSLAGTGVYTIGFSPDQQIRRVLDYAIQNGIDDYTAVVPNDAYGAAVVQELRDTILSNNKTSILKTEIFRTDKNNEPLLLKESVTSALRSAINTRPTRDYDKKTKTYNDNPIKYPRGMLIPEGGKDLAQISAILQEAKHDGKTVQLLGSGQWASPENRHNTVLEGAWFAGPPDDRHSNFESSFESAYGYKPMGIAGLAYDGIALAATLAKLADGKDFSKEALEDPKGFIGVDGIFRFRKDGLCERGLAVMTVKDGNFVTISPAPENFVGFTNTIRDVKKKKKD
jgi:ABC-type branched-subunit amino acid transport system substrate-binding protein